MPINSVPFREFSRTLRNNGLKIATKRHFGGRSETFFVKTCEEKLKNGRTLTVKVKKHSKGQDAFLARKNIKPADIWVFWKEMRMPTSKQIKPALTYGTIESKLALIESLPKSGELAIHNKPPQEPRRFDYKVR